MTWFDAKDARLLAKVVAVMASASVVLVGSAAALGAAIRVFHIAAGG